MDSSNPDFIIQPSNKGDNIDARHPLTNAQPQHTITLTLTSPAPGVGGGGLHGSAQPGSTPGSLIVSGIPGLSSSGGQMHYAGASISATPIPQNIQSKATSQNYVMSGPGGGQSLIVSGATMMPGLNMGAGSGHHDNRSAIYGSQSAQSNLCSKGTPSQSYVMSSGSIQSGSAGGGGGGAGHDSGDEGHSIHSSNNSMGHDQGPSSSDSHQSGQTERLKVEDALNYLDQVKYKFGNQPQVYNDFLDIMKEFKSQSIDTPGVISRVSNLFRGHPELIVGFNTFLPPGYKIEVQTHDQGSQISYRVDGVTSYVVTNMPSIPPPPAPTPTHPTLPPAQQVVPPGVGGGGGGNNPPQIIQHTASSTGGPMPPLRSSIPVAHSGVPAAYGVPSVVAGVAPPQGGQGLSSVSNGSISPPPPAVTLTPSNASNFENVVEPTSSFTHSFSSPFAQNAFPSLQSQPVQFNHAINYVNKIKNRFCGQPDKYKQFLDILHSYQKEQRNAKEGIPGKTLSEHEVYSQVAKIFENQEDLLQEFGQFLPESNQSAIVSCSLIDYGLQQRQQDIKPNLLELNKKTAKVAPRDYSAPVTQPTTSRAAHAQSAPNKRASTAAAHPVSKKPKLAAPYKDISVAEASRYGTLHDYAFFDKCRTMLKHQSVFDNFIRCLYLFNEEVISRQELLNMVQPFFCKNPEMYGWLKEFVNRREEQAGYEPISQGHLKQERPEEQTLEIGEEYFSTCKRLGASYCALPKNHVPAHSSARTPLCREVLNDVWVSFPTWSEDSTFVTSRKTQYEEYICRCEDERFELDVIIEANADTIRTFEAVSRRMARMSHEELKLFELTDALGGTSDIIHIRSVRRVYGDKAGEIIEGLKRQPFAVIPIVLKRLKSKEEEWRESQRSFNKIWRDQVERFYLKSLDHQGLTFKQSDVRMLRSKALVNEIETVYDERHDQENGDLEHSLSGPHLTFQYVDRAMLDEATNLLLHHVRRQSGIQNDDKRKIKQLLKHFIPDLFNHTRMDLSDDEAEGGGRGSSEDCDDRGKSPVDFLQNGARNNKRGSTKRGNAKIKKEDDDDKVDPASGSKDESRRTAYKRALQKQAESIRTRRRSGTPGKESRPTASTSKGTAGGKIKVKKEKDEFEEKRAPRVIFAPHGDQDETYTLFYANNAWYVFLRLHQIMVERLGKMLDTAAKVLQEELKSGSASSGKVPPAVALGMRTPNGLEPSEYFPAFIDMVKNVLDGNMEPSTYEDTMRELFGIHAYISYTMDKVVTNAVRQLQTLVSDEVCMKFTDLFLQAVKKGGAGGSCDTCDQRAGAEITYQKQAEKIDPEENCYKVIFYHKSFRMTMELLEGANIEENAVETTKWSAYIDSYSTHPLTGMDSKMKSLMKPAYLNRNVRVGQQYHANKSYPPEVARIFGLGPEEEDVKPIIPPFPEKPVSTVVASKRPLGGKGEAASSTGANSSKFMLSQTLAPVTPEEAEELEKQLERNSKRRSELVQKELEVAAAAGTSGPVPLIPCFPKISLAKKNLTTNNPVTPEEAELLEKQLEANAKRRAETAAAIKSPYVIKENLQCKFHPNSYRIVYVVNSENYFYSKGALKRAKQNHKKVTTRMNEAFGRWHQIWMENSVTEDQIMRCEDWLMSTGIKNSDTKIISSNDISLAPYRPFNRYVVKK
ncbi:paired amphipathic helix protein Sin3a isoform X3 [Folsomia candida]|uniref:paired amphipathic helix protein Sin3a isoform X3 n=1 Tax=Folsomia candida TaxID=158441 RepID=UPI000B8FC22E|nr:paired amphipathic helix protein Sin3a isoform X3 [Folsomia candida]